jgi:endogenous inhibitor of DNA gyrase (YacG/DUF329 family)
MRCPICHREVSEREQDRPGSAYPFCSDRCKLIDLGRWLSGRYQIPVYEEEGPIAEPPAEEDGSVQAGG